MSRVVVAACACLLLLSSAANPAAGQARRGRVYVDRGACEGEACMYGPWKPMAKTVLRARPDARSRKVGEARVGPCVRALTGEVHVRVPGRLVVVKPHGRYRPGDALDVYNNYGEDMYKVRYRGRWIDGEHLIYSQRPGPQARQKCEADRPCWAFFERRPDSDWWIKVRTPEGVVGWTNEPQNFEQPYWQSKRLGTDCKEPGERQRRR